MHVLIESVSMAVLNSCLQQHLHYPNKFELRLPCRVDEADALLTFAVQGVALRYASEIYSNNYFTVQKR